MSGWFVQVKGCGGDGGRSILLCGKGYRQHPQRGEQMSASRHCNNDSPFYLVCLRFNTVNVVQYSYSLLMCHLAKTNKDIDIESLKNLRLTVSILCIFVKNTVTECIC